MIRFEEWPAEVRERMGSIGPGEAPRWRPGPEAPGIAPLEPGTQSLCIVHLSAIGDVVHGLPVATAIRRARPDLRILWIAEPGPAEVVRGHPAIDRVVVFHRDRGLRGVGRLAFDLRGERPEVTLNLQRYFKSIPPTLLTRARTRVGLAPSRTRDGVHRFLTHHLPEGPWRHTQDLFREFLDALGIPTGKGPEWELTFSEEEEHEASTFFARLSPAPRVGVVLASKNARKDWPVERSAELAHRLAHDFGYQVIIVGGLSERESAAAAAVRASGGESAVDGRAHSVRRLLWMVRGLDLLVSPDTGPLHIAHALGVPVIGLYAHTNPWRLGPYVRYHDLVVDRYAEADELPDPSSYASRGDRMDRISVEEVLDRVDLARRRYGVGR